MKRLSLVILLSILCGCAAVHHMDQLLVLADYSRDKNVQQKTIDKIDANYDALIAAINAGKIKNYPDQSAFLLNFGEPIARKIVTVDGKPQQQWLYRHAVPQKAKDKVYVYFDNQEKFIKYTQEKIEWS